MKSVEEGNRRVQVQIKSSSFPERYNDAAKMYMEQVAKEFEDSLALPVDAYHPAIPPWS
jgi:hypothetical protein